MFSDSMFAAFSGEKYDARANTEKKDKEDPFAKKKQEKFNEDYAEFTVSEAPVDQRKIDLTNIRQDYKQDYKREESIATMPSYYSKEFNPHEMPKDRTNVEVRQTYLHHLLSKYTPIEV